MTDRSKQDALETIIQLASAHDISADEISARLINKESETAAGRSQILTRVMAYLGGLLVFAGIVTFVHMQWAGLGSAARVVITFGPGLAALVLGIATLKDSRFVRVSTPMFLMAAALQPTGLFVALREYSHGDNIMLAQMLVYGVMAIQMIFLFYALRRTNLLLWSVLFAFGFLWSTMDLIGLNSDMIAAILGLSGLLVTTAINRTEWRSFTPFAFFVFAICFATGIFELIGDSHSIVDFALIPVAGAMIFGSVKAQSRSFLCASVLTMLGYLGFLTDEFFAGAIGWPIALIVMGLMTIGLSAYALRLGRGITAAPGR